MYQVFNIGNRMEIYCPEEVAQDLINISTSFNVDAQIVGRVSDSPEDKRLSVDSKKGSYTY